MARTWWGGWRGRGRRKKWPELPVNALLLFVFYLKKWLEFILLPGKAASLYDDKIAEFTREFIYTGFERQNLQWEAPVKSWVCWLSHFPWPFCRPMNPLLWQVSIKREVKSKRVQVTFSSLGHGCSGGSELKLQLQTNRLLDVCCCCSRPTPHVNTRVSDTSSQE